jgi:hypothetical protein
MIGRQKQTMNQKRAIWAENALIAFSQETGQFDHILDRRRNEVVNDLLCDLMHFCDLKKIDFKTALDTARQHYHTELLEEKNDEMH